MTLKSSGTGNELIIQKLNKVVMDTKMDGSRQGKVTQYLDDIYSFYHGIGLWQFTQKMACGVTMALPWYQRMSLWDIPSTD